MTESVIALIPMRQHSERVPGKNIRLLGGKPLYHHIVDALNAAEHVSGIVIDTDSAEIWEDVGNHYPHVQLLSRPARLAGDKASAHEIVYNTVTQVAGDFFLQTHSTNPLLSTATIESAIREFFENAPAHDSLFSVTPRYTRFYTAAGQSINHDPLAIVRTQDLEPVLEENSCLYLFGREGILQRRSRIGENPLMFRTTPQESVDIDDPLDFVIAEAIYTASADV